MGFNEKFCQKPVLQFDLHSWGNPYLHMCVQSFGPKFLRFRNLTSDYGSDISKTIKCKVFFKFLKVSLNKFFGPHITWIRNHNIILLIKYNYFDYKLLNILINPLAAYLNIELEK